MNYFKFKRTNVGSLILIGKFSYEYYSESNDGGVMYSENEIENVKDDFIVNKNRVVKSGKTWLINYNKKNN
jgi:hypothetical protein